jgi:hypothetical protein
MTRWLLAIAPGLILVGPAAAQCLPWQPYYTPRPYFVPAYPMSPAIWGAPAPKPLPPAPAPFVPRPGVGLREDDELQLPAPKPKVPVKLKVDPPDKDPEFKDVPRIGKPKVPIPGDTTEPDPGIVRPPDPPTKKGPPAKEEPRANGRGGVEQFFVPAANRAEPLAQVKVGFFNHTDREIALVVNGESVRVASEDYVTLRLPRSFQWAERGQKATDVAVPPDADGIEIVFRK